MREKLFPFRSVRARSNVQMPRQTIKDPPRAVRVMRPTPTVMVDPFATSTTTSQDTFAPITPATAVDLEGNGGTHITATPADLRRGPQANITDFVIVRVDAGNYGVEDLTPGPDVTTGFLLEDGSGLFMLEDFSGYLVQEERMSGSTSPTAAWVDATGIHAPGFAAVQTHLISSFQAIYGADVLISADNQDGQLIGVFALAISDTNAACVAVYNSFSPSTAQGVGLSSNVKINGMKRAVPTNSSVTLTLVGEAGRQIIDGMASDLSSNLWLLPASVTIPPEGQIDVTALAANSGEIQALPNTITHIQTPTRGWQTVTNPTAAVPGDPIETDAALRRRQSQSTAMPALSVLDGITGAVLAIPGVLDAKPYENDTDVIDPITGLPPHSICLVVRGGDIQLICDTILTKKTPGCYTYGNTRRPTRDLYGIAHDIGFVVPTQITIRVQITITAKLGYLTEIGDAIKANVANYITNLTSGDDVIYSKLWSPANLIPDTSGLTIPPNATDTYDITSLQIAKNVGALGTSNIIIALGEEAACTIADVTLIPT